MKKQKPYSFFFHYNKPLSQQRGKNILSVHFRNACHFVESLSCNVPIATRNRKTQPRCVMSGRASSIELRTVNGESHAVIQ